MPFFKCKVSRAVFTDDLKVLRVKEHVYVEAKDDKEARNKAGHPRNWIKSTGTLGKADKSSSFLLTVEECGPVDKDEAKALRSTEPALAPSLFHQSAYWGEHDDRSRVAN
jgi:hypothetical protein